MSKEKFSLNADPRDNYVNLILNDIKNLNFWKAQRLFAETVKALGVLLLDLPPAGQKYMKQEIELICAFEKDVGVIDSWESLYRIQQKILTWVWPNILQEYFQAKPRNPSPTVLGE